LRASRNHGGKEQNRPESERGANYVLSTMHFAQ
jgi:hypothetical protein